MSYRRLMVHVLNSKPFVDELSARLRGRGRWTRRLPIVRYEKRTELTVLKGLHG